jgi:DNA-binding HxlR family transcriptional regulator
MFMLKQLTPRSSCVISTTLDLLGDKWTLLILRDILFTGKSTYGEFLQSAEKIATNILADRLALLADQGIVTKAIAADKKSKFTYRLTEKGLELAPILVELMLWGAKHVQAIVDPKLLAALHSDRAGTIHHYQELARAKNH